MINEGQLENGNGAIGQFCYWIITISKKYNVPESPRSSFKYILLFFKTSWDVGKGLNIFLFTDEKTKTGDN